MEVTNRFKGLYLIDRVPEKLWMEVHHCTGGRDQDQKKICKKAKQLSEEALKRAMKRKEVKGKREKERCTHLNAEFQRITRKIRKPSSVISAKK